MDRNIEKLIDDYLRNSISSEELDFLENWVSRKENEKLYRDYILTHYNKKLFDSKKAFELFEAKTFDRELVVLNQRSWPTFIKYAAIFMGILISGYFVYYMNQGSTAEVLTTTVTLEIEGGDTQILNSSSNQNLTSTNGKILAKQKGNVLDYADAGSDKAGIVFNILKVPYGKTFQVVLSDNTQIYLNAGSQLRYPNRFKKSGTREVLLQGEAYFKVSKNKNSPFMVKSNGITTEVFGTEFNISSYTDDSFTSIVLVEGSVGVTDNSEQQNNLKPNLMLKPNEMASKTVGAEISIKQVDIAEHVSWIDGTLFFKNESFGSIVKKLQRHFNVVVTNNNKALEEKKFTGRFDIESVEQILKTFQKTNNFSYIIKKNNIIINP